MSELVRGAASGAAGVAALNAATYADMALRGRPPSKTPEQSVVKMAERARVSVPGDRSQRGNRISGLGGLLGVVTGVSVGAVYGAARFLGWRPSITSGSVVATVAAMSASAGPMTWLRITDPRRWSGADWLSDLLPHLAYGVTMAGTHAATTRPRNTGER